MVFWSSLLRRIKENVPGPEFLKLKKKVEKNTTDISSNLEKINTNTEAINATNETVNTNSSDISHLKTSVEDLNTNTAKLNSDNTFTGNCNFTHDNIKVGRIIYGGRDEDGDTWLLPRQTTGKRTLRIGNSTKNDNQRFDLNMENRSYITNLPNPTANQHAANKQYVDSKIAEIPTPDLSNYLTITDAQANYARCQQDISNDWYSTNTFRKTPQLISGVANPKDVVNKEYVDGIISTGGTLYIKESNYVFNGTKNGAFKFNSEMTLQDGDALTWNSKVVGFKLQLEWIRSGYKIIYRTFNYEGYVRGADGSLSYTYGARIFIDDQDQPPKLFCYYEKLGDPYAEQNVKVIASVYHV